MMTPASINRRSNYFNLPFKLIIDLPFNLFKKVISTALSTLSTAPIQPPSYQDIPFQQGSSNLDSIPTFDLDYFSPQASRKASQKKLEDEYKVIDLLNGAAVVPVKKTIITLQDGVEAVVSKVFVEDLKRSNSELQKIFLNGHQIAGSEDEGLKTIIEKLYDLLQKDPDRLFRLTVVANQNAMIDLRGKIEERFKQQNAIPVSFNAKFRPLEHRVYYQISIDIKTEKFSCELIGKIGSIERPPASIEDFGEVRNIIPVYYKAVANHNLLQPSVDYDIQLSEKEFT